MQEKLYYERNLPHWHPTGRALFVTWRLHGSLPKHVLQALEENKKTKVKEGQRFVLADRELDKASFGPLWLEDPRVAKRIVATLRHGERELLLFDLHAFVVMANHVHVLLTAKAAVARILRSIKRKTAADANQILNRTGQPFWQEESYDHWCRTEREFARTKRYIELNPVKAGLVERPEDWPWSSCSTGL